MSEYYLDVRCILLCKAFQTDYKIFDDFSKELGEKLNVNVESHIALGEYDGVVTFKLDNNKPILKNIANTNKILSETIKDSIFYRPLFLAFPDSKEVSNIIDRFWDTKKTFFFVTIVHSKHCYTTAGYKKEVKNILISGLNKIKNYLDEDATFLYRVYYSFDLSDFVIVWKSNEPYYVLEALRYIYEKTDIVAYTNTISSIPFRFFNEYPISENIGNKGFSIEIKAVANSFQHACKVHEKILNAMMSIDSIKETENSNEVKNGDGTYFTFGNEDYLGFFDNVSPTAFYQLFNNILRTAGFKDAILSLNTTIAINGFKSEVISPELELPHSNEITTAKEFTEDLHKYCFDIKNKIFELFKKNEKRISIEQSEFHWQKSASELLVLLDNMSKSAIFDSVCFLFLDSIKLFYDFLCYLIKTATSDSELHMLFFENELNIESFIKEWERLSDQVVSIDGTFQKTPGYESLNNNMSASIVEYHNAYTQEVINYYRCIDECSQDNSYVSKLASFVVPKMCRRFKTQQWFFDDRRADSLLFITIPLSKLYDPFFIITSLTHEISHYCSNVIRQRKDRFDSFVLSISTLICYRLELYSNKTIIKCYNKIKELFYSSSNFKESELYLTDVKAQIKNCVFALFEDTDNLNTVFDEYINELRNTEDSELDETQKDIIEDSHDFAIKVCRNSLRMICLPYDSLVTYNSEQLSLYTEIDEISSIYKEAYADLMMVYILSLEPIDYIKAAFLDIHLFEPDQFIGKLCGKFQRMFVVCDSMIKIGEWDKTIFFNTLDNQYHNTKHKHIFDLFIQDYQSWLEKGEASNENAKYYYPKDILITIADYLTSCITKLIEIEEQNDCLIQSRNKLKNMFSSMIYGNKDGIFTDAFLNSIQHNRDNILKHWLNREKYSYIFSIEEKLE